MHQMILYCWTDIRYPFITAHYSIIGWFNHLLAALCIPRDVLGEPTPNHVYIRNNIRNLGMLDSGSDGRKCSAKS